MALSNQDNHLVLTTGNKSELAVGYSTLYGDSVGGFNPLKDVPKTLVWQLARWRNADAQRRGETPPIPENSIAKPPSAELRPGQLDSDSLPDYEVLDAVLRGYVDGDLGRAGLLAAGHDQAVVDRVLRLVDIAEYKRRQSAPGTKISIKAFGRDRRLPITNRFRDTGVASYAGPVLDPSAPPTAEVAALRGAEVPRTTPAKAKAATTAKAATKAKVATTAKATTTAKVATKAKAPVKAKAT
jgi:hypothetical protein